jgi:serine/threonine protein phosphatase PrpC
MRWIKRCLKKIFPGIASSPGSGKEIPEAPGTGGKGETVVLQPSYTVRLKPDTGPVQPAPKKITRSKPPKETAIVWCGLTDTGRVRTHNEDYFSCMDMREGTLFVVADGMGGHDAGEVASRIAVETVRREVRDAPAGNSDPEQLLRQAVQQANSEVLREGSARGSNMGTTITTALVLHDRAFIANVGDSRIYWIENGSIRRITTDHSLVQKLVSLGRLTEEEARKHPKSNVLYRTIGSDELVSVDTFQVPLKNGGSLLLCTDGLWGEMTDHEMHRIFAAGGDIRETCTRLISTANNNGGKDNITAVVVKVV